MIEVVFLDVDEGYQWVGGAEVALTPTWQHIAMDAVYTTEAQRGHEIQVAFLLGLKAPLLIPTVAFLLIPSSRRRPCTHAPPPPSTHRRSVHTHARTPHYAAYTHTPHSSRRSAPVAAHSV